MAPDPDPLAEPNLAYFVAHPELIESRLRELELDWAHGLRGTIDVAAERHALLAIRGDFNRRRAHDPKTLNNRPTPSLKSQIFKNADSRRRPRS